MFVLFLEEHLLGKKVNSLFYERDEHVCADSGRILISNLSQGGGVCSELLSSDLECCQRNTFCVTLHTQKNVMPLGESVRLIFKARHPAFILNTWLNVSSYSTLCLYFALLLSYLSVAYVSARWPHLDPVLHRRRYIYSHSTYSLQTSFCHLNPACDEVFLCLHSHWSQARR